MKELPESSCLPKSPVWSYWSWRMSLLGLAPVLTRIMRAGVDCCCQVSAAIAFHGEAAIAIRQAGLCSLPWFNTHLSCLVAHHMPCLTQRCKVLLVCPHDQLLRQCPLLLRHPLLHALQPRSSLLDYHITCLPVACHLLLQEINRQYSSPHLRIHAPRNLVLCRQAHDLQ